MKEQLTARLRYMEEQKEIAWANFNQIAGAIAELKYQLGLIEKAEGAAEAAPEVKNE